MKLGRIVCEQIGKVDPKPRQEFEVNYRGDFPDLDRVPRELVKRARRILSIDAEGMERVLKDTDGYVWPTLPAKRAQ